MLVEDFKADPLGATQRRFDAGVTKAWDEEMTNEVRQQRQKKRSGKRKKISSGRKKVTVGTTTKWKKRSLFHAAGQLERQVLLQFHDLSSIGTTLADGSRRAHEVRVLQTTLLKLGALVVMGLGEAGLRVRVDRGAPRTPSQLPSGGTEER